MITELPFLYVFLHESEIREVISTERDDMMKTDDRAYLFY